MPLNAATGSGHDLLYVSNTVSNEVYVFRFPQGELVETLKNINEPYTLCSDSSGNVFVMSYNPGKVLEFAHGAKKPTATIVLPYPDFADACAADPTSASLAVIDGGEAEIYGSLSGLPTGISAPHDSVFWHVGYDANGNLFLDGETGRNSAMWEVPKGTTGLLPVLFPSSEQSLIGGQVQWDGEYITVEGSDAISRITVAPGVGPGVALQGTVVSSTTFDSCNIVWQSWIVGSTLIVPCSNHIASGRYVESSVKFWTYPAGGKPVRKLISRHTFGGPYQGVTVSVVPSATRTRH
jgi:WD40 repeat protein